MRNKTIRSRRAAALACLASAPAWRAQRVGILLAWFVLLLAALSPPMGHAQIGNVVDTGTVDKVQRAVKSLSKTPPQWDIRVVNEEQWQRLSFRIDKLRRSRTAFTIRPKRITVIRKSYVDSAAAFEVRKTLAHEAGHIFCQCDDEDRAERLADHLLP